MTRRLLSFALPLAAALSLTSLAGCATFTENNDAASVGARSLSSEQLSTIADNDFTREYLAITPDNTLTKIEIERQVLTSWLVFTALRASGAITDADLAAAKTAAMAKYTTWATGATEMQDIAIEADAVSTAVAAGTINSADLRAIVAAADIAVDSRYGWWNTATFMVTPFG